MANEIKVLVIGNYGTLISARPEAEAVIGLFKKGIKITVISRKDTEYSRRFIDEGIRFIGAYPERKYDLRFIRLVRKELKEGGYHILQLFSNNSIYNGLIASLGISVKVVLYRGYTGNIHWYDPSCYLKYLNWRVDKIICLAEAIREMFHRQLFFKKEKAITINKGHDPQWYETIRPSDYSEFGLPVNIFKISCVANARRMKGIKYLIMAMDKLPIQMPIHLFLIGSDMDKGELKRLISRCKFNTQIHVTGYRNDSLNLVAGSDLFILPSIKGEATTKALIEAMSLGIPSVTTSIPGNRELAINGTTALTVPVKNPAALATAIEQLYYNSELRKKIGWQSKQHVINNFHINDTVRKISDLYKELV